MSLIDLTGQVAIVTASTKGIGRGIVERKAEHGPRVVVSGRNQPHSSVGYLTPDRFTERWYERHRGASTGDRGQGQARFATLDPGRPLMRVARKPGRKNLPGLI